MTRLRGEGRPATGPKPREGRNLLRPYGEPPSWRRRLPRQGQNLGLPVGRSPRDRRARAEALGKPERPPARTQQRIVASSENRKFSRSKARYDCALRGTHATHFLFKFYFGLFPVPQMRLKSESAPLFLSTPDGVLSSEWAWRKRVGLRGRDVECGGCDSGRTAVWLWPQYATRQFF